VSREEKAYPAPHVPHHVSQFSTYHIILNKTSPTVFPPRGSLSTLLKLIP